jgi:hypothetical protein
MVSSIRLLEEAKEARPINVLINGNALTIKEENMWSCQFKSLPVTIVMTFLGKLTKVRIWNFNKNIQELSKGVRACEILLNN